MVDIKRERPKRPWRKITLAVVAVVAVAAGGAFAARAKPKAETVRRASVWTGPVERSPFVIRVKGAGTLVPEAVRWLTAEMSGRVEEIMLKPGARVEADTKIVRLENLDIRLQAVQSERDVASARSELLALERGVREDELAREGDAVSLRTTSVDAKRRADVYGKAVGTMVSGLDTKRAEEQANELEQRAGLADRKLEVVRRSAPLQIEALRAQLAGRAEMSRVRKELVDHLLVRAGAPGVLQDVLVELGQWVVPGTNLAKVIVSDRLKAELRIPEEQAGGISVGQKVSIDIRPGTIAGTVRRVAGAAKQGTVKVEVELEGELPKGARADQSVDGFVEIERTPDTLHIPRPIGAQPNATVSLFRLDPKTGVATRITVRTGRASVDALEIVSGLQPGDEVILSDTSRYANTDRLQLE